MHAYDSAIYDADRLQLTLADYTRLPGEKPPARDNMAPPRIAGHTVGLGVQYRSSSGRLEQLQMLQLGTANFSGEVLVDQTVMLIPRTSFSWLSGCIRDTQCGGPANYPVTGWCSQQRCYCPLPWTGYRCDRKLDCRYYQEGNGWDTNGSSRCELRLNATTREVGACACSLFGTFDVTLVEEPFLFLKEPRLIAINFIEWKDFDYITWENIKRSYGAVVVLGTVTLLYALFLTAACMRGNEKEINKNRRYYDFWREQRQLRLLHAGVTETISWKRWRQSTFNQLRSHTLLAAVEGPGGTLPLPAL